MAERGVANHLALANGEPLARARGRIVSPGEQVAPAVRIELIDDAPAAGDEGPPLRDRLGGIVLAAGARAVEQHDGIAQRLAGAGPGGGRLGVLELAVG